MACRAILAEFLYKFWPSSFTNFGRVPLQVVLEEEEIRKQETINCDVFFFFFDLIIFFVRQMSISCTVFHFGLFLYKCVLKS